MREGARFRGHWWVGEEKKKRLFKIFKISRHVNMLLYIGGLVFVFLVAFGFYVKSLFVAPKGGVVKVHWKDRHSLPTLSSRIPLILAGALFKKEGRFYPGLADFPETHLEVGSSEYVRKTSILSSLCVFRAFLRFLTLIVRPTTYACYYCKDWRLRIWKSTTRYAVSRSRSPERSS